MSQSSVGYQDIIYNTIDTLINERMGQLSIDNILTGIITDESRKDQGIYKVKSNNVTYEVQGENNAYKKDAIVQFSVPKDDGVRVIIGECRGFNEKPLVYLSLTDQFISSWEYEGNIKENILVDRTYSNYYNALYFKGNLAYVPPENAVDHYAIKFTIYIEVKNNGDFEEKNYVFQYSSKDMIGNPLGTTASFMREALFSLNNLPVGRITKISCEALNCRVSNFVVQLGFMAASKNNGTVEIHCLNAADESSFKGPAYIYKGGIDGIFYSKNQTLDSDGKPIADFTEAKYDNNGKPSFSGRNSFDHNTLKRSFELIYYNRNEDGKYIGFGEEGYKDNKAAQLKSNFMPEPSATGYSSGTENNDLVTYRDLSSSKRLEPSSKVKRENETLQKMQLIYDLKEIIDLPEVYKLQLMGALNNGKYHNLNIKLSNGVDDPIELLNENFQEDRPSFTIIKNIKIEDKKLSIEESSEDDILNLGNTLNLIFEVTKPGAQNLNTNISLALSTLSIGVAQPVYSILWETNAYDGTWAPLIIEEGTPLKPVFKLNPALPQNQFRAKLYSGSDIPTESNTITFYQTDYNGEALKMPSNIKINITHGEGSKSQDDYPFYDDYMQLINPAESMWDRQVILNLEGLEGYTIDLKTFLKGCKIYWGVPESASMLLAGENPGYEEATSLPKLAVNKYIYYYDDRYESNIYTSGAISGFNYRIQNIYQPQHINNSIHCILVDTNDFEYQATIVFGFSARGNYGTDYTLIVKEINGKAAYVPEDIEYELDAKLYDPNGTEMGATITWDSEDENKFTTNNITRTVRTATAKITDQTSGRQITLSKDFPIPYATNSQYIYQGPVHIVYDMTSTNPQYWDGAIRMLNTITADAQPTPYICKIGTNGWEDLSSYEGYYLEPVNIKDSAEGVKLIVPPTFYERNDLAIIIMSTPGKSPTLRENWEGIRWVQPLIIRQQRHYYDVLNQWDGNLTIDKEGNRIMAAAYAAGRMEGDNSFTGVITGEKGKFVDNEKQIETGIFGYNKGAETFALRTDGTFDLRGTAENSNTTISIKDGKLEIKQQTENGEEKELWSHITSTVEEYSREMGESIKGEVEADYNSKIQQTAREIKQEVSYDTGKWDYSEYKDQYSIIFGAEIPIVIDGEDKKHVNQDVLNTYMPSPELKRYLYIHNPTGAAYILTYTKNEQNQEEKFWVWEEEFQDDNIQLKLITENLQTQINQTKDKIELSASKKGLTYDLESIGTYNKVYYGEGIPGTKISNPQTNDIYIDESTFNKNNFTVSYYKYNNGWGSKISGLQSTGKAAESNLSVTAEEIRGVVSETSTKYDLDLLIKGAKWHRWTSNGRGFLVTHICYGTKNVDSANQAMYENIIVIPEHANEGNQTKIILYVNTVSGEFYWCNSNTMNLDTSNKMIKSLSQDQDLIVSVYFWLMYGLGYTHDINGTEQVPHFGYGSSAWTANNQGSWPNKKYYVYLYLYSSAAEGNYGMVYRKNSKSESEEWHKGTNNEDNFTEYFSLGDCILPQSISRQQSEISQKPDKITLSVSSTQVDTDGKVTGASIELGVDGEKQTGTINLQGLVTFSNLSTSGKTEINGDNITTGSIRSRETYTDINGKPHPVTEFNLGENGYIRSKNMAITSGNFYLHASSTDIGGTIHISSRGDTMLDQDDNRYIFYVAAKGKQSFISLDHTGILQIQTPKFSVDRSGNVSLTGVINAEAGGTIGGWKIAADGLYYGDSWREATMGMSPTSEGFAFWAGGSTAATAKFRVTNGGVLHATGATITGNITANSISTSHFSAPASGYGSIAGWNFDSYCMWKYGSGASWDKNFDTDGSFLLMSSGTSPSMKFGGSAQKTDWRLAIGTYFGVDSNGNVYCSNLNATNGNFSGDISAASFSGQIIAGEGNTVYTHSMGDLIIMAEAIGRYTIGGGTINWIRMVNHNVDSNLYKYIYLNRGALTVSNSPPG